MKNLIEKYNMKYISKRIKAFALVGALAFTSMGCGQTKKATSEEATTNVEATTSEIDNNVENTDVNSKYYSEISNIEDNVVNIINDGLSKGLFDLDLDDSMKEDIARTYLDYYMLLNKKDISGKSIEIMNQDRDINAIDVLNSALTADLQIQEQTIISQSGIELNYENIIVEENDRQIIQKLADIIASMHTAIENNNETELETLKNEVIEIKDDIIQNNSEYMMTYNPMTLDLVLMLIDAADSLTNGAVITDEEDKAQLLNTSYVRCLDGEYVSDMTEQRIIAIASEFGIENYQNMTKEEILEAISNLNQSNVSEASIRDNIRSLAKASFAEIIANTQDGEYDENYSYKNVIKEIANRIDLSLQVRPEQSSIDFENSNPYGPNVYKGGDETGKKTTKTVDAKDVPPENQESTETNYTDENGNPIEGLTDVEIIEANNAGDAKAAEDYRSGYRNPNPSVAGKSAEWNKIYASSYNTTYNGFVKTAEDIKKNENKTTEYIQVDNNKTETTTQAPTTQAPATEVPTTQAPATEAPTTEAPTEEYINVEDGEEIEEVIEEGVLTSSILKEYKNIIYSQYLANYADNYLYGQNQEENVRKI